MSAGGVFTLIANEGRTDRLLLATALLNQRIQDIQCARRRAGKMDCWPTLVDIERTHVLFMNAHYKPFVAIGYEYNKVKVQTGTPNFGQTVVFSIPQFGDFFYDIVCRVKFREFSADSSKTPEQRGSGVDMYDSSGNLRTLVNDEVYKPSLQSSSFPRGCNGALHDWDGGVPTNGMSNYGTGNFYRLVRYDGKVLTTGGIGENKAAAGKSIATIDGDTPSIEDRYFTNLIRWVEYPANRLFKKVWFNVNNNPLDEYTDIASIMYQKFCVPVNKEIGYNRMTGQEVPHDAWSGIKNVTNISSDHGASKSKNWISHIKQTTDLRSDIPESQQNAWTHQNEVNWNKPSTVPTEVTKLVSPEVGALDRLPSGDPIVARYLQQVVDGPQTPKEVQPPLEIMHRLQFWFNEDVRLAVPSVSIPYGQRFIHMDLAKENEMVVQECGLFVEHIKTSCGITPTLPGTGGNENDAQFAFGPSRGATFARSVARSESSFYPYLVEQSIDSVTISDMELYINNIFVNPEIHDIYIRRIGFTLIRVHRIASISIKDEPKGEKLISQLKWPIEYMFVGIRPTWNTNVNNRCMWRDWHRMTKVDTGIFTDEGNKVDMHSVYDFNGGRGKNFPVGCTHVGEHVLRLSKDEVQKSHFAIETNTVDTLNVTAHGITLYDHFSSMFYNNYIPYQYGGYNIKTPSDPGALMITFCLFPRTYQPSGHLNVSRAREFYIGWTSSYIGNNSSADLLVVASAINFLLISDGSAVLRYST